MKKFSFQIFCVAYIMLQAFQSNSQNLEVEMTTELHDTLHIRKNTTTPWGHEWLINNPLNKIWMKQTWSGSTGDRLYISSSGSRDNNLQGAIILSEKLGHSFGDGNNDGANLTKEHMRLTKSGDLFLGGLNADNAKPKMRIKRLDATSSGLLIENEDGSADTWLPYTDGNNYITGDRSNSIHDGRTFIRSYQNGQYTNHIQVVPVTDYTIFDTRISIQNNDDIIGINGADLKIEHAPSGFESGLAIINSARPTQQWIINEANDIFDEEDTALKFIRKSGTSFNVPMVLQTNGQLILASDSKLKKDVRKMSNGYLDKLNMLIPSTYRMLNSPDNENYGFIAQDVQKIYPNLVSDMNGIQLGVNYIGFIPVLTKCIQEQQQEIEKLKTSYKTLEEKVETQSKLIQSLLDRNK